MIWTATQKISLHIFLKYKQPSNQGIEIFKYDVIFPLLNCDTKKKCSFPMLSSIQWNEYSYTMYFGNV